MQYWIQEHNEWSTQQNEVFWRILKGWGFRSEDFKTGPPGRSSCLKRNSDCTFWTKERQRVAKESLAEMNARHKTDGPSVLRISMVSTCFNLVKFGDTFCSCQSYSQHIAWIMALGPRTSARQSPATSNHRCKEQQTIHVRDPAGAEPTKLTHLLAFILGMSENGVYHGIPPMK